MPLSAALHGSQLGRGRRHQRCSWSRPHPGHGGSLRLPLALCPGRCIATQRKADGDVFHTLLNSGCLRGPAWPATLRPLVRVMAETVLEFGLRGNSPLSGRQPPVWPKQSLFNATRSFGEDFETKKEPWSAINSHKIRRIGRIGYRSRNVSLVQVTNFSAISCNRLSTRR